MVLKRHTAAFLISIVVGGIYVSHHFFIPRVIDSLREAYYPVTLQAYFDEASFYGHRAHAAYLGQWNLGDIHTAEYEGGPALMPLLSPVVLGFLGRISGSMARGFIISDFIFPAAIFFLIYAICYELTSRRTGSLLASSLFLFIPTIGVSLPPVSWTHINEMMRAFFPFGFGESTLFFSNFEDPKITFLFFTFALWVLVRALKEKTPRRAIFGGIGFGLLFYVYLYAWATFVVTLALLFILLLCLKDNDRAVIVLKVLLIGFGVSIPYWINLAGLYQLPQGHEIAARAGREISHALRVATVWKSYVRIAVLMPLLAFFVLKDDGARRWKIILVSAFLLSYAVVVNVQVVTGFNIHPDHWYRVQFLPVMLAVFLLLAAAYDGLARGRMRMIGKWTAFAFLVYFLAGQAYYQYALSSDAAYAKNFVVPRARMEAYQWLSEHTSKGSVVAAFSFETNRELPLHTHNKIYVPHGLLTIAPDEEIWDRFFFVNRLFGVLPDEFRKRIKEGSVAYYLFEERYTSQEFDSAFRESERRFPQSLIDEKTRQYEAHVESKDVTPRYQLDYVYTDERDGGYGMILDDVVWLEKVYDNGTIKIYKSR